jgi:hypothetical protein
MIGPPAPHKGTQIALQKMRAFVRFSTLLAQSGRASGPVSCDEVEPKERALTDPTADIGRVRNGPHAGLVHKDGRHGFLPPTAKG